MKTIFIGIAFLVCCKSTFSQKHFGNVIYKKEYIKSTLDTISSNSLYKRNKELYDKFLAIEIKAEEILEDLRFTLKFNQNESIFSVQRDLRLEESIYYGFAVGPYGSGVYYTSLKQKEYLISLDAYGELFLIEKKQPKWEITSELKKIGDYTCYKATTIIETKDRGKNIKIKSTAWFSPDIPVSHGPLGYVGLPGLVLELEIGKVKFFMSKIELNPKKTVTISKPNRGKKITSEQFADIGNKTMNNFKKTIE